jgi:thiaminase/transcriptional activator TenA
LDELKLHEDACARWGVDDGALETIHPASRAYVDFLTALQSPDVPMDELVAGMTPCTRLYAALGRDYLDRGLVAEGCAYREWFDAYGGDEMGALAASLEALLPEVRSIQTFVFHPSLGFNI